MLPELKDTSTHKISLTLSEEFVSVFCIEVVIIIIVIVFKHIYLVNSKCWCRPTGMYLRSSLCSSCFFLSSYSGYLIGINSML